LRPLPAFELSDGAGGVVRSWDLRGRRHLVLCLMGATPDRQALRELASREPAIESEGAVLLVAVRGSPERAAELGKAAGLGRPVLADPEGRVHARLGADVPTLVVADWNATVYWRGPLAAGESGVDEALSWLGYLNILEPECGTCVPAWPPELFAPEDH
jgi:predicted amidohydrolase